MKYIPWLIAVVLLVCIGWLFPSYRKVVKDSEEKSKTISDLQTKLVIAKTQTVIRVPVYIHGKIAYRTVSTTSTNSSTVTDSHTVGTMDSKSHQETTAKRGGVGIGAYWGLDYIPKAVNVDASILGPIGAQIEVFREPFQVMGGIHLSL
jgi:hypothetical protein